VNLAHREVEHLRTSLHRLASDDYAGRGDGDERVCFRLFTLCEVPAEPDWTRLFATQMLELEDQLDQSRRRWQQKAALEDNARSKRATLAFLLSSTHPRLRAKIQQSLSKLRLRVAEESRLAAEQWTETEQLVDVILELVLDSKRRK